MQAVVEETRVWALACALPISTFSKGQKSSAEMKALPVGIFGPHITERKISAVFAGIGLDLLADEEEVLARKQATNYLLTTEEMLAVSSEWVVPEAALIEISRRFGVSEDMIGGMGTTWSKAYKATQYISITITVDATTGNEPARTKTGSLSSMLSDLQRQYVHRELAQPHAHHLDRQIRSELDQWLGRRQGDRWDNSKIEEFALATADVFTVYRSSKQVETRVASIDSNCITLFPSFFDDAELQSIKAIKLLPLFTRLEDCTMNWPETLIHEITHSTSLLNTWDPIVNVSSDMWGSSSPKDQIDLMEKRLSQQPFEIEFMQETVYGDELVFLLGGTSKLLGRNSAEESADSWAVFSRIRLLQLMYPEYRFTRSWHVEADSCLQHHCSLFDCMRHPDSCSITDLVGYDESEDPWSS